MGVVFRLELARVLRSRALVAAMLVWAVAAAAALVNGDRVIERQRRALAQSDRLQAEQHDAVLAHQPPTGSAGDQLYYLAFHTRHHPSSWASLSIGQRDQRSFNVKVRALALHGQLYDGDLTNPLLAALGTFDFAFVLVALVPLLVVALCHDLVSGEREAGTWPLVKAQPAAPLRVLMAKVGARYAVLLTLVCAAVAASPFAIGAAWDGRVAALMLTMAVYLLAWVSMSMLVATLGRPSDVNALVLLGVWVLLVVVGPALVVMAGAARYPTPEALELTVAQRQGYHASWDRPVPETMAPFVARYPQWANTPVPTDRYSTAWYYAMQQRGDDEAAPAAAAYRAALVARQTWVGRWLRLLPPADVQRALDRLARTDLQAHLAYLDSVASFHETLERHFLPVMFQEPTIAEVNWRTLPRHDHRDEGLAGDLLPAFGPLAAWLAGALGLTWLRRATL
jgi:ABC-2 type transport system permease protein